MSFGAGIGAGDLAEVCVLLPLVGITELRCIGQVSGLCTELKLNAFRECEVLKNGEIKGSGGRTRLGLQAYVAFRQSLTAYRRKIGSIEPLRWEYVPPEEPHPDCRI